MSTLLRTDTSHDTEVIVYEFEDGAYVEVSVYDRNQDEAPNLYSFTPEEARRIGDALLTGSQRVEDRQPHGNS